ncbi:hypothetical protein [Motilibacter peucedani]|nr:hypothetical protein [Motilibacter peucedani]
MDDNDSAIASGGPGRPSGDDWRVLAARSVRPRTVGAAIHLVHGTHVVNPITMIVAEQASTGDWTVCVVQTTSSGRYGLSNSAGPGRLDPGAPPDNGLTRVNGNFGNHAVAFTVGRYGSKVTGVRVASSAGVSDAALLRNGVYIGVVPVSPTAYRFPPTGELRSITATAVTR